MAQTPDCVSVQTGTFKLESDGKVVGEIIRTHEYQLERYPEQKVECRFKVEWINDCTFRLKHDSCNKAGQNVMAGSSEDVIIEITKVEGDVVYVTGYMEAPDSPRMAFVQRRVNWAFLVYMVYSILTGDFAAELLLPSID